jgi:RteC protein
MSVHGKILMPPSLEEVSRDLEEELERIQEGVNGLIPLAEQSLKIMKNALVRVRNYVLENPFSGEEEEIYFFKFIKPSFLSRVVYYTRVLDIETRMPPGGKELQSKFLKKELRKLNKFSAHNREFYQYYRSGATYMDKSYFLRGQQDIYCSMNLILFNADPLFTTIHDFKLATILANESLSIYLNIAFQEDRKGHVNVNFCGKEAEHEFKWSDSKTDLIELIYALQSKGSINNAGMDVKQVAGKFERLFNINLGNYYKTFQEIRIRKKGRTNFLDQLKEKLVQRMDESDENGRRQ